ncbi:MAG TPA: hypothetical protein VF812_01500 [Ktedonobacterales bacterium]
MRRLLGYALIAISLVAGVYVVFLLFQTWLGSGTSGQILLDGLLLAGLFVVFCAGYYLVTAIER